MAALDRGLYEVLITEALQVQLRELGGGLEAIRDPLRAVEAADRIALHLARVIERAIEAIDEKERAALGISLACQLIAVIRQSSSGSELGSECPLESGEVLRSVVGHLPDGRPDSIAEPLIPLLDTTLLTNAPGEPRVGNQVLAEIHSADRIDVVMAFIGAAGSRRCIDALRAHCQAGREVRVLTTTYTGSTEARALDQLRDLGADVRVSYDETSTRLHAKAWLFHRHSGFSTAYIGSSNLTHSAQVNGLEWNIRVSSARNPSVIDKVAAVFESYWHSGDFVPYDREQFLARTDTERTGAPQLTLSPIELRPEPFQERLLEQIALSRRSRAPSEPARLRDRHREDGDGSARLRPPPRGAAARPSLFVAHREEILTQTAGYLPSRASRPRLRRAVGRPRAASGSSSTSSHRFRACTPPGSRTSTRLISMS